jgi:hypothetical protein
MGWEQRAKEAAMDLVNSTKDARGRLLQEGDEIILNAKGAIYFRIASITPTLDPNAPPDLIMVHVAAIIPFVCKRGALNPEFVRVRTVEEAGPMNFSMIEAKPDPDPAGKLPAVDRMSER